MPFTELAQKIMKERQEVYQQELEAVLGIQHTKITEGFSNTTIEPSTQGLFTGKIGRWSRLFNNHSYHISNNIPVGDYVDEEAKNAFLAPLKSQINSQKETAKVIAMENKQRISENRIFIEGTIVTHYHGVNYIKPNQPGLPYLPAPDPLFSALNLPAFLKTVLEAQTYGVGELQLSYDISDSRFQLHLEMHCLNGARQAGRRSKYGDAKIVKRGLRPFTEDRERQLLKHVSKAKARHAEECLVDVAEIIQALGKKNSTAVYSCVAGKKRPCMSCSGRMMGIINVFNPNPGSLWLEVIGRQRQDFDSGSESDCTLR